MFLFTTIREIVEQGCWDAYCILFGLDTDSLSNGEIRMEEEVTLSYVQAERIGFKRGEEEDAN